MHGGELLMTNIVNSWNEWDPLERVIVGRPEGTQVPAAEPAVDHHYPEEGYPVDTWGELPQEQIDEAAEQMENFVDILKDEGVKVDRVKIHPELKKARSFGTPDWTQLNARGGNNPRDLFLPVGNEIMEAPGTMRSRFFEYLHLRPIFEEYFKKDPDFLWTAAPRPRLTDESYEKNYWHKFREVWSVEEKHERQWNWNYVLTEKEPLWDAADASRMGKDIFWHASAVTNRSGMDWLKRYFGSKGIRIHKIQFSPEPPLSEGDEETQWLYPWHIDTGLIPLKPGLAIYNPQKPIFTDEAVELFEKNDWELIPAAEPSHHYPGKPGPYRTGKPGPNWISMNTLSLDPETVFVEAHENKYIKQLEDLGFDVIPVPYDKVRPFGGALHCTTLDVKRKGELEDYFPNQIEGY